MSLSRFPIEKVRSDFPILTREVHGKPLVYFDNAATLQKPRSVIEATDRYYSHHNANVHRGVHLLSQEATDLYEGVRPKICRFLGTQKDTEIIYTRGTTEAINLVSSSISDWIQPGDTIAVTRMEHHSNFVPWQQLALRRGAKFAIVELTSEMRIDLSSLQEILKKKPKILAFSLMSNVTGVINDAPNIARMAKEAGALVFADGAQAAAHIPLRIETLGPLDFLAFSAHKIGGPTGIGVLWGREELLKKLPPYQFGGDMISQVRDELTTWNSLPWKFEAGTPNIAGAVGLGAAIDYLESLGLSTIQAYETELAHYALKRLAEVPGLRIFGPANAEKRGAVFSFTIEAVHPHDLATFLDMQGFALRAGHHCAQPLLERCQIPALTRASISFINTPAEIDGLTGALKEAVIYFNRTPGKSIPQTAITTPSGRPHGSH